jgi:hypothetical protein
MNQRVRHFKRGTSVGIQQRGRRFTRNANHYFGAKQTGAGLIDNIKGIIKAGRAADKFAAGPIGTVIKNLIPSSDSKPSSDSNARNSFPGERHAILKLPNGRAGIANYMG